MAKQLPFTEHRDALVTVLNAADEATYALADVVQDEDGKDYVTMFVATRKGGYSIDVHHHDAAEVADIIADIVATADALMGDATP
jgi:hypothetical protein